MDEERHMKCELKLLSSLEKIFFEKFTDLPEYTAGSMLKNEIFSFQLATWGEGEIVTRHKCKIQVESELAPYIQMKKIDYVPSMLPLIEAKACDDYLVRRPGVLFPDPLHTIKNGEIEIFLHQARALWITIEPKGEVVGTYPITFKIYNPKEELIGEKCFTIDIIDQELPELDIHNTCWFHGDCLAALHNVEILSEEYYEVVKKYLATFAKFGHNMILTPIFTPPLDTVVGGERPTNQLIDVVVNEGKYSFGFDKLKYWINLCHSFGIKYFEMAHFFTQWGAYHAPKIMATVDGEYKKIFGWETDALSDEYKEFLHTLLPELIAFLKAEGVMDDCLFHVSDEPREVHETQYRNVKDILLEHLDSSQLIDALSDYSFYEKGIVTKPVVSTKYIQDFIAHDIKGLWAYYCTSEGKDVSNRFMAMPSYRNRILGYQLYKYEIAGFLQWGYNFWFKELSVGVLNPYEDTTAGGAFQSGDAFVVYPLDEDGEVVCSTRLYVFHETMQDLRALKLLEALTDRQTVMDMLGDIDLFASYPRNNEYIIKLREQVNSKIKALTSLK